MSESNGTVYVIPGDRSPLAAAHRVDAADAGVEAVKQVAADHLAEINQRLADIRDAGLWNVILTAKEHGQSREVTEDDVAHWRMMRAVTDRIAENGGEGEFVPQGFGPAVRTRQAEALMKLATSAAFKSNEDQQ